MFFGNEQTMHVRFTFLCSVPAILDDDKYMFAEYE